jgi:hypothetical protein
MNKLTLAKILPIFLLAYLPVSAQNSGFTLPSPTGEYKVGTTKFYLKDVYREETFTEDKYDYREFMIRAWYPVDKTDGYTNLKYLEGYNIDTLKYFWDMFGIPEKLFDLIGHVNTSSFIDAPISNSKSKLPVIIFSHGYGLGIPELYTIMSENLASNGYIVYSLTHPYESVEIDYPNKPPAYVSERANEMLQENLMQYGTLKNTVDSTERITATESVLEYSTVASESLEAWVKDAVYLLNQLEANNGSIPSYLVNSSDLDYIGALGHSFGGAMSGQFAFEDGRIKAVMNLDGFQYGSLMGKTLDYNYCMVYSDYNKWMNDAILTNSNKDLFTLMIPFTQHFSYTDMPSYPEVFNKKSFTGAINYEQFNYLLNTLITDYFNRYLQDSGNFPDEFLNNFPEVMVKQIGK